MISLRRPAAPACLLAPIVFTLFTGCIRDQIYQPVNNPPAPPALSVKVGIPTPRPKKAPYVIPTPAGVSQNHATVEFFDHGDLADPCPEDPPAKHPKPAKPHTGVPCQRTNAINFIRQARKSAGTAHVVVLTFIHGNENNASYKSDNYPHFEQLINCLNLGEADYTSQNQPLLLDNAIDPNKPRYLDCKDVEKPGDLRYVGIYIGWRGALYKGKANLQQNAGMRIGKANAMAHALFLLRNAAKDALPADQDNPAAPVNGAATFVVVGHSFGGLLLEQTATRIFKAAYTGPASPNMSLCQQGTSPAKGYKPFTDLILTVNEAVNAIPAKHLIEFFQGQGNVFCHDRPTDLAPALTRPLILGIHSKSDVLTGRLGTYVRTLVPSRGGFFPGRYQGNEDSFEAPPPLLTFAAYRSTPANLGFFQSLCYFNLSGFDPYYKTGEPRCDMISEMAKAKPTSFHAFPSAKPGESIYNLYVRFACTGDAPASCTAADPSLSRNDLHIWNRSPYWLMSVDDDVISGHDDFWTYPLIALITDLAKCWPTLTSNQVIQEPATFLP